MRGTATQKGSHRRAGHDPRAAALLVLDRVLTGNDASQAVLDAVLRESNLVPSDKGLCTELVYGYLRNAIRLDWHVRRLLADPQKLPAEMLLVLGIAAYELAHLSRIPAHASVNWAVSRVRNRFGQGLSRVANGVLRAFARSIAEYGSPATYAGIVDEVERLSVIHAVPAWIVSLWMRSYGEEAVRGYLVASSRQAVPAMRVNALRDKADKLRERFIAENKGEAVGAWGVAFSGGVPYEARQLEKQGRLSYQSAGVQEALAALDTASWKGPVWDVCAGRGGKTTALMELGIPVTAATDIAASRIEQLPGELARLGLEATDILVRRADATLPDSVEGSFAAILADVPCSGLGTLSRRPEIRYRRTAADIADLCRIQDAILDSAAAHTQSGGHIMYMTCTLNPEENEERVRAFCRRSNAFVLEREWTTPHGSLWCEFFYAAVIRRQE